MRLSHVYSHQKATSFNGTPWLAAQEGAAAALTAAVQIAPSDLDRQEAEELQEELARKKLQYRKKAKAMFRKMRKSVKAI